jgi:hypothetical protein
MPELSMCKPGSLFFLLALWVSVVLSLCKVIGGVLSAKLMASNRDVDMAAWLGVTAYASFDVES